MTTLDELERLEKATREPGCGAWAGSERAPCHPECWRNEPRCVRHDDADAALTAAARNALPELVKIAKAVARMVRNMPLTLGADPYVWECLRELAAIVDEAGL